MFTKEFLIGVRRKALRRGVWLSALDGVERGILTLTSRLVDEVRSTELCIELVKIMAKIKDALRSGFVRKMESYGLNKAKKLVTQATGWGYKNAETWIYDINFLRYITMQYIFNPSILGYNRSIKQRCFCT